VELVCADRRESRIVQGRAGGASRDRFPEWLECLDRAYAAAQAAAQCESHEDAAFLGKDFIRRYPIDTFLE
jgi:hypothetical protein